MSRRAMRGVCARSFVVWTAFACAWLAGPGAGPAQGLTILGSPLPGAPPPRTNGSGNLDAIFRAAADFWERAILDEHTVTIHYAWVPSETFLGFAFATEADGRVSGGSIVLSNSPSFRFFLDPTPYDDAEFYPVSYYYEHLGSPEGPVNVGRVLIADNDVSGSGFDLLSVVLHEIGHALGFLGEFSSFHSEALDRDVDVKEPLPFAGASLPLANDNEHMGIFVSAMFPTSFAGMRRLPSAADILAVAQVNGFTEVNLDPPRVPEPGSALMLGSGVCAIGVARRRRQASRSR